MADAWGLTGEVGGLVTGGPGHANAVAALYTALEAESPVVLLSGHAAIAELGKGAFQEMRQRSSPAGQQGARPVRRRNGWPTTCAERCAKHAAAGPVHLSMPQDVLEAEAASRRSQLPAEVAPTPRPFPEARGREPPSSSPARR